MRDPAIRLADGTPLILGDVLCLALLAFLATRLWVAAAPALGRRVGRLFLATVLPLGFSVSVVAHGWVPERARAMSEALDISALLIAIPIGLWWAGALIVYWARRLWRRERLPVAAARASDWLRMAAATAPLLALAVSLQWTLCREETKTLARRSADLTKQLRALEATARLHEQFFAESDRLDAVLQGLRRELPVEPEIDAFVAALRPLARDQRLELLEWSADPEAGAALGALRAHSFTLEMKGEIRNLPKLAARSRRLPRLSTWHRARVRNRRARVEISVYTAPERSTGRPQNDCAHEVSDVWLWPYSVKVAEGRAGVDRVCAELLRLAVVQQQVDRFQSRKAWLRDLVKAIETVRASERELPLLDEPEAKSGRGALVPLRKET